MVTPNDRRGLVLVMTGHGKGKTTAAIGQAVRAAGQGHRVIFFQFVKGTWTYGELDPLEGVSGIEVERMQAGYSWEPGRHDEDRSIATAAWARASRAIVSGEHDLVVLDDIHHVTHYRLLPLADVVATLRRRPAHVHLVLTGRNAPLQLLEMADQITEMQDIKHHFRDGVLAQPGIEY